MAFHAKQIRKIGRMNVDVRILFDIVVVGAGPAGLAAGYYCAFFGLETLILESGKQAGGRMLKARKIGNYLGFPEKITGTELAGRMTTQTKNAGAQLQTSERVVNISRKREVCIETGRDVYYSKALILATGAGMNGLGLEGETWVGDGISYCSQCNARIMEGMNIVVIGNTERAVDEAICLSKANNDVKLVNHSDVISIGTKATDDLRKNKVELVEGFAGRIIKGKPPKMQLILESMRNSETKKLEANLLCVVSPSTPFVFALQRAGIATHQAGCVVVDQFGRTNTRGIFAAGSCASIAKDIIPSCIGDGTAVAAYTCLYIMNETQ
jgi:thioredoxin reductase (NADPH)